jgi:hypothetical protein
LLDEFVNRQSAFPWIPTLLLFLVELFLYSYEADFIQRLLKGNEKNVACSFDLCSAIEMMEQFGDTKGVIRIYKSKDKGQTTIYKTYT